MVPGIDPEKMVPEMMVPETDPEMMVPETDPGLKVLGTDPEMKVPEIEKVHSEMGRSGSEMEHPEFEWDRS